MLVAYISGPISGKPNLNHPAFFGAEEKLTAAGYEVFNPARHPAGLTEAAYMQLAMVALPLSDLVVCLDDCADSTGAVAEIAYAVKLEIPVMSVEQALSEVGIAA